MAKLSVNAREGQVKPLVNCTCVPEDGKGEVEIILAGENDLNLSSSGLFVIEEGLNRRVYYMRSDVWAPVYTQVPNWLGEVTERDGVLKLKHPSHELSAVYWQSEAYLVLCDLIWDGRGEWSLVKLAEEWIRRLNSMAGWRVLHMEDDKLANCLTLVSDWLRMKRALGEPVNKVPELREGGGNG